MLNSACISGNERDIYKFTVGAKHVQLACTFDTVTIEQLLRACYGRPMV